MSDNLMEMDAVLDEESYDWLWTNYPALLKTVELGVKRGEKPEAIKRRALQKLGMHREALATRCELAAKHLERNQ